MAKKNVKNQTDKRVAKKAAVLGTQKKSLSPLLIIVCVAAIGTAAALYWFLPLGGQSSPAVASRPGVVETAQQVSFPVAMFDDGRARHFEYKNGNKTVRYFVMKSSDGVIRAAFDACDVCWPAGKGYYQEGDHMVCRNCGRRFASVLINEVKGGCNPAPLDRSVHGDKLILKVNHILEGYRYFDFKGRT